MDKPILFSGPMVRALLDGRKTQTRRMLKIGVNNDKFLRIEEVLGKPHAVFGHGYVPIPYASGDRLWVREAWSGPWLWRDMKPSDRGRTSSPSATDVWYWADGSPASGDWERPRPSIHMPCWASRLTLTVTDVRVQRLQDISEADALAEGIVDHQRTIIGADNVGGLHREITADGFSHVDDIDPDKLPDFWPTAGDAFMALWDDLNEARAPWHSNPWVAAYTFTVHKR